MPVTSPDNIYYLDNDSPAGMIPYSTTLATSIQEALDVRSEGQQLRTYRWADESEQVAQSGMQPGDMGYREDLDITYRWNGVAWDAVIEFRQEVLTLTRGVADTPLTVTKAFGMIFASARINNGNGLTLSTSYQEIATLPSWARPVASIEIAASAASASSIGTVIFDASGTVRAASAGTRIGFSAAWPAP